MLKSIFGHVKTVVQLGNYENNYNMLFEDSQLRVLFHVIEGVDANNKTQQTVVIEYEDGHWVISVLDLGSIEGHYKFDSNASLTS